MDRGTTEKKGKGKRDWRKYNYPHTKNKSYCKLCEGNGLCEHKICKHSCAQCNRGKGKKYNCPHGKKKTLCVLCDGGGLCKTHHCPTLKCRKCDGYCWYCFANLFPDKPIVRNYRTKENTVATFLKEKFPNATWKCNKTVENGCSRRRPYLLLDMGSHIVIVEVDEHSHDVYNPICEEKRLGEI